MTTPYLTLSQVKNALRSSYDSSDDAVLSQLILAVSDFIDRYCNRTPGGFLTTAWDRVLHGTGSHEMYLPDAPIQTVQRISTYKVPALYVRSNDPDIATIATFAVNTTGVTLTYLNA